MAKRKKKSKKSKKILSRFFSTFFSEERANIWHRLSFLIIITISTIAIAAAFGFLEGYAGNVSAMRDVSVQIKILNRPAWASDELIETVRLACDIEQNNFLLNKELSEKCAKNLRANPWVKSVRLVRKRYDGIVEIDCELRKPILAISQLSNLCYIDMEGVVLQAIPVRCETVKLTGSLEMLPLPGQSTTSEDILAGLAVITKIHEVDKLIHANQRLLGELAAIDVSNYEGRIDSAKSHLMLFTKKNTSIRWGAAVGRELPYNEADVRYKLRMLYGTFSQYNSLDVYQYLDLQNWQQDRTVPAQRG